MEVGLELCKVLVQVEHQQLLEVLVARSILLVKSQCIGSEVNYFFDKGSVEVLTLVRIVAQTRLQCGIIFDKK